MKRKALIAILIILLLALAAEVVFVYQQIFAREGAAAVLGTPTQSSEPSQPAESSQPTDPSGEPGDSSEPSTEPSAPPTQPTQPTQTSYRITFTGDSTLGCSPEMLLNSYGFTHVVGQDYDFPYKNVAEFFREDDLTLTNLESVFANEGTGANKRFVFRAPTEYVQVLTGSSVEMVTLANNHSMDFGTAGYETTKTTLDEAGVAYVEQDASTIYTTESGLVVGLYAAAFNRDDKDMAAEIAALRQQGAQVIVAAVHWGEEGSYRANAAQKSWGHALIDAGVDIVWGHHSHTLQPIEVYNGGIIYYSLGNFSFGGNTWLRDADTAVLQQEVIVSSDGTVTLGELTIIPCSVSSVYTGLNNYQPTPYAEGSAEYDRVLSKLDGTYSGPDLTVNYENMG